MSTDRFSPSIASVLLLVSFACLGCTSLPHQLRDGRWELQDSASNSSLRGLCVVDEHVVWAAGSESTVLRTVDGGEHWQRLRLPASEVLNLRDVHAFDAQTAYVLSVTEPASIWRTTDGGESWSELYRSPNETVFFDSFTFFDEQRACLFGDPVDGNFLVLRTSDGGETWEPANPERIPRAGPGEAAFAASGTCVVSTGGRFAWIGTGGSASRVLSTTNAGASWLAAPTPMISGEATTGIYSVAFRDPKHGIVVGGDYTQPESARANAAFTRDGGMTWHAADPASLPRGQRACVAWIPGTKAALAVGRTGSDYTLDGGRTWRAFDDEGFYVVDFGPDGACFAAGAEGRVARLVPRSGD